MTRMGKTTLAQKLAREYQRLGYKVGVYTVPGTLDGRPDPRWSFADFVTLDRAKFLHRFHNSYKVMWFVDECNRTVGWHDPEMEATGTSGSLAGHTLHYITQRAATFNLTVREQCSRLFMFRQGPKDCAALVEAFGQPELSEGPMLLKGRYLYCTTERGSLRRGDLGLVRPTRPGVAPGISSYPQPNSTPPQAAWRKKL